MKISTPHMPTSLQSQDCLTAIAVGLHYTKPKFSLSKFHPDILDAVCDMENFDLRSTTHVETIFKVGQIKVSFSHQSLIINSKIAINQKLNNVLPKKEDGSHTQFIQLPMRIYAKRLAEDQPAQYLKEKTEKFREGFLSECAEMINLLDKIVDGGLPAFRFVGIVEYYAIPLHEVVWEIFEKFKKQAQIDGWDNTEKRATNRYYFPSNNDTDERCLIFQMDKPDDHKDPAISVAGASFDLQFIPQKVKLLNEYGGAKKLVEALAFGITETINNSHFMNFQRRT